MLNHTATMSGGERVLLDLVSERPEGVEFVVASPAGPLHDELGRLGIDVRQVPGTAGSLKLHPIRTPVALAQLVAAGVAVRRLARSERIQLLHANSPRAALSAILASPAGRPPVVTHLHDAAAEGHAGSLVSRVLERSRLLIANSHWTASTFPPGVRERTEVVHNPVDLERFAPRDVRDDTRSSLGVEADELALLHVAQITPWKAQDDSIRVLAGLRSRGLPCRLFIAGSAKFVSKATRFDNREFEATLRPLAEELGVGDRVTFLGEREDTPALYEAADLVLLPSWAEPYGLALAEAMATGTLVAATSEGGTRELLKDGEFGLLLPPREPDRWVDPIEEVVRDPAASARLAAAGQEHVRSNLSREAYANRIAAVYRDVIAA